MRPPGLEAQLQASLVAENWPEYNRLAALMDAQDEQRHQRLATVTLAASALWYAEQGLHVFMLQPRSKIPYPRSKGFKDATTDPDTIRQWWRFAPDANIGIATGHRVDVIDIDGMDGNKSLAAIIDELPPRLGWVSTPRPGGRHFYVPASGRGNAAGIFPGIDYRGIGGYVVAPPSRTEQGRYEWVKPLELPAVEATA
jgi:hypothetical protein